jgi:hypothetical protein
MHAMLCPGTLIGTDIKNDLGLILLLQEGRIKIGKQFFLLSFFRESIF